MRFSLFHQKCENGPFWTKFGPFLPKMPKNRSKKSTFYHFHPRYEFFARSLVSGVEKMKFSLCLGKLKNGPFWPIFTQIWPKRDWVAGNFLKILSKIYIFLLKIEEKIFQVKKSTFCPYDNFMTPLSPHVD